MTISEIERVIAKVPVAHDVVSFHQWQDELKAAWAAYWEASKPVDIDLSADLDVLKAAYDKAQQEEVEMWATVKPLPGTGLYQHENAGVMRRKVEAAMNAYWEVRRRHNPEPKPEPPYVFKVPDNFNCLDYTEQRARRRDKQEEKDELMEYQRAWQGLS